MDRQIRNAAKALVIHDGRLLAVKISDGRESWFILPGGGQLPGEQLPQAVCREVAEETGILTRPLDLAFVIEGVRGESFHRVDLVFLCEYLGWADTPALQSDSGQVGFEWLDLRTLNLAPLYPSRLRRPIMNLYEGKPCPVYLGNEEIGDPEITT